MYTQPHKMVKNADSGNDKTILNIKIFILDNRRVTAKSA